MKMRLLQEIPFCLRKEDHEREMTKGIVSRMKEGRSDERRREREEAGAGAGRKGSDIRGCFLIFPGVPNRLMLQTRWGFGVPRSIPYMSQCFSFLFVYFFNFYFLFSSLSCQIARLHPHCQQISPHPRLSRPSLRK